MNEILNIFNEPSPNITKIIGGNSEEEYNYLIKKIYELLIQRENTLIFNERVPIPTNFEIISLVQESVLRMNLYNIKDEEIILTGNSFINNKIKSGIDDILQEVLNNTNFKSKNVKYNFFIKQIVWIYEIINKFDWTIDNTPLIVFYGVVSEEESYLLKILNIAGVKIVNINSLSDNNFLNGDIIKFDNALKFMPIEVRVANSKEQTIIKRNDNNEDIINTWAKQAKDEFDEQLYKNNDSVFRPWSFRQGTIKAVNINAILEDINIYIKEQARYRPNFKVENEVVYIPNFMCKINGVNSDLSEYVELIDLLRNQELTVFKNSCDKIVNLNTPKEDIFSLAFIIENNNIDFEKAKSHKLYNLNWVNLDTQKFIIKKLNDFIVFFENKIDRKKILSFISVVFDMNKDIVEVIERFDFPFSVPKLVIFEPRRNLYDELNSLFLIFLNMVGFDIILLSPIGTPMIEDYLYGKHLSIINLDKMQSNLDLEQILNYKSDNKISSILKKFFNK